jgi:hypothetical protein
LPTLDNAERAAVLAEYDRVSQEKPPANVSSCGCLLAMGGGLVFFGLPALLSDRNVAAGAKRGVIVLVVVLLVAGIYTYFRGNRPLQHAVTRSEWATAELERFLVLAPEERRRAAVTLLWYGHYSGGPYTATTYKPEALRRRISDALAYVTEVEQLLVSERKLYRVFTAAQA